MKTIGWTLFFSLAAMTVPACLLETSEGITTQLSVRGIASSGEVSLTDAWVHLADASLVPCEEPRAFLSSVRSVAHAHHGSADGRSLGSHVVHIVERGEGMQNDTGVLRPVPARYCALRVEITPAGPASDGFVESIRGLALHAEGARDGEALTVRAEGNRVLDLPLMLDGEPTELVLDEDARTAAIVVEVDLARALAAIPPSGQTPEELGLDLLVELDGALTARVRPGVES